MARRKKPAGPTPVESYKHQDQRTNIPTADDADMMSPQVEQPVALVYPRNPELDPQLVWRGKDFENTRDLVADAPPLYIQEKIYPEALVENLRRTAERPEDEPELTLFESFDNLDALAELEHYQHETTWTNRMILGDSLLVMASLAERERLRGKVQMIYIDPPYGIKFGSNWQPATDKRDVKDGNLADVAREVEQIKAFRDTWELGVNSYLSYLRDRLTVARDLLTESGSCFVQIGDENVHLVRSLMDEVFGRENFVAEASFFTTSGRASDFLDLVSDKLLWFAKDREHAKYRELLRPRAERTLREQYTRIRKPDWSVRTSTRDERLGITPIEPDEVRFMADNMASSGLTDDDLVYEYQGRTWRLPPNTHWKTNRVGRDRLSLAGRLVGIGERLRYVRLETDFPYARYTNLWDDTVISGYADSKVYVVQTSPKVTERCLLMTTDPGDLVLDPTCGSGTTAYVAEQWGRRWITIDTSRVALALARQRLMGARYPYYLLADSKAGKAKEAELSGTPVPPDEGTDDLHQGFVYERVQHITLKSIANNPDIGEGMSREEIDEAIRRHADFEVLYDRPYEDKAKVRVTGPFTVESVSPHRSVAFGAEVDSEQPMPQSEAAADTDASSADFAQSVLDNLAKAGIQNGTRGERIEFSEIEPFAGSYIQAVGERGESGDGGHARIGLAIGPQYGTIDGEYIRSAAREAIRQTDVDLLCVLGFSFDPAATGVTEDGGFTVTTGDTGFANVAGQRGIGRIQVLLVRINPDLLMGDLKKTDAANLFTVFGEPDIDIRNTEDGQVVVQIRGIDVYNPTTGEIRSGGTDKIALWMIDTDYDESSFFVRHCYFTGGNDPYKKLKTALKADIDADAWASLQRTESRPFAPPSTGKIAVKVINVYGDEVMKVFTASECPPLQ